MDKNSGTYASPVAIHPGETLADELAARGMKQNELALRLGMSEKTITHIITGKAPITVETANKLESVLDIGAGFWLRLEAGFQASKARRERQEQFEKEVGLLKAFPIKGMVDKGWIPKTSDPVNMVESVAKFFGVASLKAIKEVESVAYRKAATKKADPYALAAWLRKGVVDGGELNVKPYSPAAFKEALGEVRKITATLPKGFDGEVRKICAEAGVAVVCVPHLDKTHVNGAARWLSANKPLIQLSLRFKWEDIFWFSFFHEAAHILHHKTMRVYIDYPDGVRNEEEALADRWSADFLIPPEEWKGIKKDSQNGVNEKLIRAWGERLGIANGIIVGRLQHEGLLGYDKMNHLRRQFEFVESRNN